jgi:membrane protein YqaA with SNARE-associated domain
MRRWRGNSAPMSVFRPLYDWSLRQAKKPYAEGLLFLLAATEPCLSPVPPDVLLLPMAIAHREKAFRLAIICLCGVIIGSLVGYGIGAVGMATIGHWVVDTYHLQTSFKHFHDLFDRWGLLIVVAKGLLPIIPIPLTFLVIASGMAHLNLAGVLISMAASQGSRFFFEAWLIHRFGEPVRKFIERYLTWVGLTIVAVITMFFLVATR